MACKDIEKLRKKYGDGIILFHTTLFGYECLAKDAHTVSKECGIELEKEMATYYCSVKQTNLKDTITTLLIKGHKVAVLNRDKPSVFLPQK